MRTIGKRIVSVLLPSGVVVALMLGSIGTAYAIGEGDGINTVNGDGPQQIYGNQLTAGDMSPQLGLVQGTLNKPCIGLPAKINAQSLVALVNVGVQDINVLSNPQNQQCTEGSTQAKGDESLSHILDNIPVLSGNVSAAGG